MLGCQLAQLCRACAQFQSLPRAGRWQSAARTLSPSSQSELGRRAASKVMPDKRTTMALERSASSGICSRLERLASRRKMLVHSLSSADSAACLHFQPSNAAAAHGKGQLQVVESFQLESDILEYETCAPDCTPAASIRFCCRQQQASVGRMRTAPEAQAQLLALHVQEVAKVACKQISEPALKHAPGLALPHCPADEAASAAALASCLRPELQPLWPDQLTLHFTNLCCAWTDSSEQCRLCRD